MNRGESSTGLSIQPLKRRRGRPPKDPSLKRPSPIYASTEQAIQSFSPSPGSAEKPDPVVGQAVTGVIEASLDAGYLLNVRIGNSPTTLRGIVFKPGHYVPVTKENDVAPHLQMIKRNDIGVPALNDGLAIQPVISQKRKYTSRRAAGPPPPPPPAHPIGEKGHVVPVGLQKPMTHNFPNGLQGSARLVQVLDFGDKDVHMVEPLSMLPPDLRSIPSGQIFLGGQPHDSHPVPPAQAGSKEDDKGLFGEGEGFDWSDAEIEGSSDTSDSHYENVKEVVNSLGIDDSGAGSTYETGNGNEQFPNEPPPLQNVSSFSYAPGRMTELLQAVHMKENQVQFAEQQQHIPGGKIDLGEAEAEPKDGASGP